MGPLIMFALGKTIYSLIDRRDRFFVICEMLSSIVFILLGFFLLDIYPYGLRGLSIGILFLVLGLLPRILFPKHPAEAQGIISVSPSETIRIGIIDFVWLSIMATTVGVIGAVTGTAPFFSRTPLAGMSLEYHQRLLDSIHSLLEKAIDSVFILGGALAGMMAILWAGEIWRKYSEETRLQYRFTTITAIKMVIAFLVVTINILFWITLPLYNKMIEIIEHLK